MARVARLVASCDGARDGATAGGPPGAVRPLAGCHRPVGASDATAPRDWTTVSPRQGSQQVPAGPRGYSRGASPARGGAGPARDARGRIGPPGAGPHAPSRGATVPVGARTLARSSATEPPLATGPPTGAPRQGAQERAIPACDLTPRAPAGAERSASVGGYLQWEPSGALSPSSATVLRPSWTG